MITLTCPQSVQTQYSQSDFRHRKGPWRWMATTAGHTPGPAPWPGWSQTLMCHIATRTDTGPRTSLCRDVRATPRHFPANRRAELRNFNLNLIRGEWASGLPGAGRASWRCTWSTWSRACSRRPPARGASQDELSGSSWGQERHPPAGAGDTSAWAQPRGKPEPGTGFRQNVKHR